MPDLARCAVAALVVASLWSAPGAAAAGGAEYGPTGPQDTLWSIATRLRPAGATIEQTMLALTSLNPEAFVGPQGNLIIAGATLRAPTLAQAQAVDAPRALRIVQDPEANWLEAVAMPTSLKDEPFVPPPPAASSLARPVSQAVADWRRRAEDAELRVAELEQERSALQSKLDEEAAVAARAERRVAQLEAQVARRPRSTAPFGRQDEPDPILFWSGLGGAGFVLLLAGLLMGRRRGRPRVRNAPKGPAPGRRGGARPAADFAAAEALGEPDSEIVGPVRVAGTSGRPPPRTASTPTGRKPPVAPQPNVVPAAPPACDDAANTGTSAPAGFANAPPPATVDRPNNAAPQRPAPRPEPAPAGMSSPDATPVPDPGYATATKLNLARAYADLNDSENVRAVCMEVMREGDDAEREAAKALLARFDEPIR